MRTRNEREGVRTANGVDKVPTGSRLRRELDFVHRFPSFPWFSSVGNAYEQSTLKLMLHIVG